MRSDIHPAGAAGRKRQTHRDRRPQSPRSACRLTVGRQRTSDAGTTPAPHIQFGGGKGSPAIERLQIYEGRFQILGKAMSEWRQDINLAPIRNQSAINLQSEILNLQSLLSPWTVP